MRWLLILSFALAIPLASTAQSTTSAEEGALSQLVETVLQQVAALHPGMQRSALDSFFVMDGGLNFPMEARYSYRRCPLIRITVRLKPAVALADKNKSSEAREDDVIVEVSKPYLDYEFKD